MNVSRQTLVALRARLVRGVVLAGALSGILIGSPLRGDDKPKADPPKVDAGMFFPIAEAKDCALDETRQRLYVTTPKKLVVVDLKKKQIVESIELAGSLQ